jgi:hypothetical protein
VSSSTCLIRRKRATEYVEVKGLPNPFTFRQEEAMSNVKSNVLYIDQYYIEKIKGIRYRTSKQVLEIGKQLAEVRDVLGHEEFVSWVKDEFGWTEKIAQKYMQAYKEYELDAEKFPLESLFSPGDFLGSEFSHV